MKKFEWNDEKYSVGNAELDQQHRQILKILNQLVELLHTTEGDHERTASLLTEMHGYALTHFKDEEERLKTSAPELLEEQVNSHQSYVEKINRLTESGGDERMKLSSALYFLLDWWEKHILVEDMSYKGKL